MHDQTITNTARAIMEGQTDTTLWADAFSRFSKQLTEINRLSSSVIALEKAANDIVDHAWALRSSAPAAEMVPEDARQLFKNAERISQMLVTAMNKINRRLKQVEKQLETGTSELQELMISYK